MKFTLPSQSVFILFLTPISLFGSELSSAATRSVEISGEVRDGSGLAVPHALVQLMIAGKVASAEQTNGEGQYRIRSERKSPASLQVSATGFANVLLPLDFSASHSQIHLNVALALAKQHTVVSVDEEESKPLSGSGTGPGTLVLAGKQLAALPDDPDQLMKRLQFLAAASGGAPGSAAVKVDGFLNASQLPSKSSIREVRINPDQYSSQYQRPPYMGGLIEVSTKPGTDGIQGAVFFHGSDSLFNARDAFAPTRAPANTKRYGLEFSGPLQHGKSSYAINLERRDINQFAVVDAVTLNSSLQPANAMANVLAPQTLWLGGARTDWQLNAANSLTLSYNLNRRSSQNEDVGGLITADAGHRLQNQQDDIRVTETAALSPAVMNEARFGLYFRNTLRSPNSTSPEVIVPGAVQLGGSPLQSLDEHGRKFEFNDVLSIERKQHSLRAGVQIFHDKVSQFRTDGFNGTLLFAGGSAEGLTGLQQYGNWLAHMPGVLPTAVTLTAGDPSLALQQWQLAGFVQDEWRPTGRLNISTGLRYEAQTAPLVRGVWAPRLGVAYALDAKSRWILRGRAGLFYRTLDESLTLDALRLNGVRQTQTLAYPDLTVSTIQTLATGLRPSLSFQPQISLQHDFYHGMSLQASYTLVRTWHEIRSRNINAPEDGVRPLGSNQNIFQYESTGRVNGNILYVGFNQSAFKHLTTFAGYIHMDFRSTADSASLFPQSSYTNAGEWARPSWQSTHRAYAGGVVLLPWKMESTFLIGLASGNPYDITTGADNNGDGVFNDRPSSVAPGTAGALDTRYGWLNPLAINGNLARNAGTGPAVLTVDWNASRRFTLSGKPGGSDHTRSIVVSVQATNLTNHLNATNVIGVVNSPLFGTANMASAPRRFEAGLRFQF